MEMRRRDAEYKAGVLGVENAKHELAIAAATARVKEAELKTAEVLLKRIQLKSPITGIVTEKKSDEGEYVRAGDPVVQVGQLDRLRVEGRVPFKELPPGLAYGRSVRISIPVGIDPATGDPIVEMFDGQIQHVAAEIDLEDRYRVWAEIENRNDFVVRPGMSAEMTILNQ
jgi:multidrug resistance efflux pump